MPDPTSSAAAAGGLLAKLLPAGLGAAIMILVDPPQNKRELFARLFVGLGMSFLLTPFTIDFLHSNVGLFNVLDYHNVQHVCAVAGAWGAVGWFIVGAAAMWLKKFRADPMAAIEDAKKVV